MVIPEGNKNALLGGKLAWETIDYNILTLRSFLNAVIFFFHFVYKQIYRNRQKITKYIK